LIREKIKNFCRKNITRATHTIKLVLIDEADSLTQIAQEALRRSMEIYSIKARFVLICNFPSKINESIQSRCTIFRFKKLKKELALFLFLDLLKKEKIFFDIQSIEILLFYSDGDLRKILNFGEIFIKKVGLLNYKILQKSEFFLQSDKLLEYVMACYNNNVYVAHEILNDVWNNGICFQEIFTNLFQIIKNIDIAIKNRFEILALICGIRLKIWQHIPSENLKKKFTISLINVFSNIKKLS
jgi:DNA polymerase III delta prime subunit